MLKNKRDVKLYSKYIIVATALILFLYWIIGEFRVMTFAVVIGGSILAAQLEKRERDGGESEADQASHGQHTNQQVASLTRKSLQRSVYVLIGGNLILLVLLLLYWVSGGMHVHTGLLLAYLSFLLFVAFSILKSAK